MAEFHIKHQEGVIYNADTVNQGMSVNRPVLSDWDDVTAQLRELLGAVGRLDSAGSIDAGTGTELKAALSDAAEATEKGNRLRALMRIENLSTGVPALAGIAQVVSDISGAMPR